MGRTQGERKRASDVWWVPQLVQLLAEELGAVRPHLLVKCHLQQLRQTEGPQRLDGPWARAQPPRQTGVRDTHAASLEDECF